MKTSFASQPKAGKASDAHPIISFMQVDSIGRPVILVNGERVRQSRSNKACVACGIPKERGGPLCKACYMLAKQSSRVSTACSYCGKTFERTRADAEKSKRLGCRDAYCSVDCSRAHHAVKNRRRCIGCGAPVEKKTRKYCAACKAKLSLARLPPVACAFCGAIFRPKSATTTYCSMACKNSHHSRLMRDTQNPRYIDGTRGYPALFTRMSAMVYERDFARCAVCSATKSLNVHHVNQDTKDNRPENLILLCRSCHTAHHKSDRPTSEALSQIAEARSASMTSKWKETTTSLLAEYSSTTAL